jgi:hypothetical protein
MKTLIQELQKKCLNPKLPTLEVLRLAFYVAKKLKLNEFEKWVNAELNGYDNSVQIPPYRNISCQLKGLNHIRGEWQPIESEVLEKRESFSSCPIAMSIGEIEDLLENRSNNGFLMVKLPQVTERQIRNSLYGPGFRPAEIGLIINPAHVKGIIDKVKTLILKWGLDLEEAGISGVGMSFSEKEKESAKTVTTTNIYHAQNQTVIQSMNQSQVQQGTQGSIQSFRQELFDPSLFMKIVDEIKREMESLNLTPNQKKEIEAYLQSLAVQVNSSDPQNSIIRELLQSLRNIFENMSGEVAATILIKIAGILG